MINLVFFCLCILMPQLVHCMDAKKGVLDAEKLQEDMTSKIGQWRANSEIDEKEKITFSLFVPEIMSYWTSKIRVNSNDTTFKKIFEDKNDTLLLAVTRHFVAENLAMNRLKTCYSRTPMFPDLGMKKKDGEKENSLQEKTSSAVHVNLQEQQQHVATSSTNFTFNDLRQTMGDGHE